MSAPFTIAIIGRPNVGKSTLFNRLIGRRRSLVHDMPGVTRDRIEAETEWHFRRKELKLRIIDTGGLGGERFADEIQRQVEIAVSEANLVLLVLDARAGVLPSDHELLRELNLAGVMERIPVIGVVNKVDAEVHEDQATEFHALGLDRLLTVSAEHDRGMDDLKTEVMELAGAAPMAAKADQEEETFLDETPRESDSEIRKSDELPRIAVVGKPNVGKSTFINALLGQERMITSPIAGTTTDAVDSVVELGGKKYLFVDTAGVRRKSKTEQGVEVLSVVQTRKAIERAEVVVLMLDGEEGVNDQDEKIGGMIEELGRSVVIAVNKWDTQFKNREFTKEMAADIIRKKAAFLRYAPILFISARRGEGFNDLGDLIQEILHQRQLKIPTHEFTEWVRAESTVHNPANVKFYMCHQSGRNPPTFVFHVNDPEKVHYSLRGYFLNALRERWGFMGTPVRLLFIEGKNRRSLPKKKKPERARPGAKKPAPRNQPPKPKKRS